MSIKRLTKSFNYAFRGLFKILKEEKNLQYQLVCGIIAVTVACYFNVNREEWMFLVVVIFLVFLTETLNSAVERVADALKPRLDNYVKEIKDIMAGAVLFASLVAIIIGLIIFIPYIKNLFV